MDKDYTDPAKTLLDASNADLAAKTEAADAADAEVASKKKALDDAHKALDAATETATKQAQEDYDKLSEEEKKNTDKDAYINKKVSEAVGDLATASVNANAALSSAYTAQKKCNQDKADAQTKVDSAQRSYDDIEKCKSEATTAIYNDIIAALRTKSDKVNQTQYDRDSNDWANTGLTEEQIKSDYKGCRDLSISKLKVRCMIDASKEYGSQTNSKALEELLDSCSSSSDLIGAYQTAVPTKTRREIMTGIIAACEDDMTKYNEEIQAIRANMALNEANTANDAANAVSSTITNNKYADTLSGLTTAIGTSVDDVSSASISGKIKSAQSDYDYAKNALSELRVSTMNTNRSSELLSAIRAAQKKVDSAEEALVEAKAAAASVKGYEEWADSLLNQQTTMAFGQAAIDDNGKTLDENGNVTTDKKEFVTATVNGQNFDNNGDSSVKTKDSKYFTYDLAKQNANKTVYVPYRIYGAYVQRMYKEYKYSERKNGNGIATNSSTSGETTTMPVVLWVIDANGDLTGKSHTYDDAPEGEIYFIGYTFKCESDGYHIDGLQYTKPVTPPTPVPPTPTPTPETNPTTTITTIENALTAIPAVLGARRTPAVAAATPAVLGANRAEDDKAVLGAKRGAATGDDSNAAGWIALMVCAAGAGAAVVLGRRKGQKKAQ